jgi:hypothetical protein
MNYNELKEQWKQERIAMYKLYAGIEHEKVPIKDISTSYDLTYPAAYRRIMRGKKEYEGA